jgi:hypothetical protein
VNNYERRLKAAESVYLARFGENLPVSPFRDHCRLPDVLQEAVEHGKPLTAEALAERLGGRHPGR